MDALEQENDSKTITLRWLKQQADDDKFSFFRNAFKDQPFETCERLLKSLQR